MSDLTQMIRWNANFVRGLAQSVLDRAKVIRTSLTPYASLESLPGLSAVETATPKKNGKRATVKKAVKTAAKKITAKSVRKTKKAHA